MEKPMEGREITLGDCVVTYSADGRFTFRNAAKPQKALTIEDDDVAPLIRFLHEHSDEARKRFTVESIS